MVLLTGHKGYIGGHLHNTFKEALTLDESEHWQRWKDELADIKSVTEDISAIIHCGAIADSFYDKPDIFVWNYDATCELAYVAAERRIPIVFISSCAAINPHTFYGYSKLVAEMGIRQICAVNNFLDHETTPRYSILRLYNVYGDENHDRSERYSVPEKLSRRTLEYVFYPFRRDYVHVRDVVRAVQHVLENEVWGVYDVGTGKSVEVKHIAEAIGDPNTYEETTVSEILGENHPPIELKARSWAMIPNFQTTHDVFNYESESL